ncbi:MAG: hypothetical protein JJU02_07090 [Cryomorphaceae bacterium]|nr:hypothetical protein [Cryomorphaceae bacterium]
MIEKIGFFGIGLAYLLIGVSVAIILGFAVVKVVSDFNKSKNSIIGLIAMVLIFYISYAASSGADYVTYKADMNITETTSKLVNAGLVTFLIIGGIAVVSILYVEVGKMIRGN